MRAARQAAWEYLPPHATQPTDIAIISPITGLGDDARRAPRLSSVQKLGVVLVIAGAVLIFSQVLRCGTLSIIKLQGLLTQQQVVEQTLHKETVRQGELEDKVELYSSPLGVEEMARERLDMVGPDEVLVRLYPPTVATR